MAAEGDRVAQRPWGLYGLGAALALVSVLALALALLFGPQQTDVPGFERAERVLFPEAPEATDRVAHAVIESGQGRTTLERGEEGWLVAEKDAYPARQAETAHLVAELAGLTSLYVSTSDPPPYAEYGLGPPGGPAAGLRIRLVDGGGVELAGAELGHTAWTPRGSRDTSVYVRRAGEARVWLADSELQATAQPMDWVDPELVRVPRDRVREVTVVHPEGGSLEVRRDPGGAFSLRTDIEGDEPMDLAAAVGPLLGALEHLTFEDVRSAAALDEAYPERARTTFRTFDGLLVTISLLGREDEAWARLDVEAEGNEDVRREAERLRRKTAGWGYRLPPYKVALLATDPREIMFGG